MKKAHLQLKFDTTLLVIFNVIFIAPTHTQYMPPIFTLPPVNTFNRIYVSAVAHPLAQ